MPFRSTLTRKYSQRLTRIKDADRYKRKRIILIIFSSIFLLILGAFFVLFIFRFDIGVPLLLVCLIAPCAIFSIVISIGLLYWEKLQWLPGPLAVQVGSSIGWLILIIVYVVLLIDRMNYNRATIEQLVEELGENEDKISTTMISLKNAAKIEDAAKKARMISIIAECTFLLLSQTYVAYLYYRIYQEDRRRQILKATINFAAITPMELYPSAYERNRNYDTIDPYLTIRSMGTIQKTHKAIHSCDTII